jgi:hypothetical protein
MDNNKKTKPNDKEKAAANYIFNFYNEIQALNHNYGLYINTLLNLEKIYPGNSFEKEATDLDRQLLVNINNAVRGNIIKSYIFYKSIVKNTKIAENKKIEDIYKEYLTIYELDRNKLEEYILIINEVLINDIIGELLDTSQKIINSIYNNE